MTTATLPAPRTITATRPARPPWALPIVASRRLALAIRTPRALLVPMLGPVMFALVVAPALAKAVAAPGGRTTYMTFVSLATAGLLIPLNSMFTGLGVLLDRQRGGLRELLVAPIRRESIVFGNLVAAGVIAALQLAVLIGASAARGARYDTSWRLLWFFAGAILLVAVTYGLAEILATRLTSPDEYTGAVPAVAIVPFFFAGSLYRITALPHWLTYVARALPLTHALALFRYGLTSGGGRALHDIWGLSNQAEMAAFSLAVLVAYAVVIGAGAVRLFNRTVTS